MLIQHVNKKECKNCNKRQFYNKVRMRPEAPEGSKWHRYIDFREVSCN
jgi:hypothetical protein